MLLNYQVLGCPGPSSPFEFASGMPHFRVLALPIVCCVVRVPTHRANYIALRGPATGLEIVRLSLASSDVDSLEQK